MAQTQNWELQLAALVNTSDLLNFFEPENGILAGIKLKTTQQTQAHRTKFGATDSAVTLTAEVLHRDRAVRKNTKEAVEIFSYPMDASGAKRCMREAVLLKRAAMAADQNSPSIRRGLRHLIAPIGIWTTQETSFLHLVLQNPGICNLSKFLESSVPLPSELIRNILRGVLEGLELCHSNGILHCSVHPDSIYVHTCASQGDESDCIPDECDFQNRSRRPFPSAPVSVRLSDFQNCVEFSPTISDVSHLPQIHKVFPAYWSPPELCAVAVKPKSKSRKRVLREAGGKVDIWSIGMLSLTLIERNLALSPSSRTKDSLSIAQLKGLSTKQMARMKNSPRILQVRKWTTLAQDFVHACLRTDPNSRPSATQLLKHPFLTNDAETCLLSPSDVSESELSPLEDTYEDDTSYIPAPESDSPGASSDWSDEEPYPFGVSSASTSKRASLASAQARASSDDNLAEIKSRPGSSIEQEHDYLGSSENSAGSVVIVAANDDGEATRDHGSTERLSSKRQAKRELITNSSSSKKTDTSPRAQIRRSDSKESIKITDGQSISGEEDDISQFASAVIHVHTTRSSPSHSSRMSAEYERPAAYRRQSPPPTPTSPNVKSVSVLPMHKPRREHSPSPTQHAVGAAGRRSSLPLLPLTDLAEAKYALPAGRVHSPHATFISQRTYVLGSPHTQFSHPSIGSTPTSPGSGYGNYSAQHTPPPFTPLQSSSPNTNGSPSRGGIAPAALVHGNSSPQLIRAPSTKAASMTDPQPRPTNMFLSMRSRSVENLLDKSPDDGTSMLSYSATEDERHSLQSKSSASTKDSIGSNNLLDSASRASGSSMSSFRGNTNLTSQRSVPASTSSPSSPKSTFTSSHRHKMKKQRSSVSDMSNSPATIASSPSSNQSQWSESIISENASPLSISADEALAKEISDCKSKWDAEIRKRRKILISREKEIVEKSFSRMRAIKKRYDSQVIAIAKREEMRTLELKLRKEEARSKLMSERQKEVDKEDTKASRRHSVGPIASLSLPKDWRKTQFPKRVLHVNHEKSMHDLERRCLLERQEIELKTLEDTSVVESECAMQKYLVDLSQLEHTQEAERQCLEDIYALKVKMNEEIKAMTRKYVSRRLKKFAEMCSRIASDEPSVVFSDSTWLSSPLSSPKNGSEPQAVSLSMIDISPELLTLPSDPSRGTRDRYQRCKEIQQWKQAEELASLARDLKLAEEQKEATSALYAKHMQEMTELKSGFEAHFIYTRQSFLAEKLGRVCRCELELLDLKYLHQTRMIMKSDEEADKTLEELQLQHEADREAVLQLHNSKKAELAQIVANLKNTSITFPSIRTPTYSPDSDDSDADVVS